MVHTPTSVGNVCAGIRKNFIEYARTFDVVMMSEDRAKTFRCRGRFFVQPLGTNPQGIVRVEESPRIRWVQD